MAIPNLQEPRLTLSNQFLMKKLSVIKFIGRARGVPETLFEWKIERKSSNLHMHVSPISPEISYSLRLDLLNKKFTQSAECTNNDTIIVAEIIVSHLTESDRDCDRLWELRDDSWVITRIRFADSSHTHRVTLTVWERESQTIDHWWERI